MKENSQQLLKRMSVNNLLDLQTKRNLLVKVSFAARLNLTIVASVSKRKATSILEADHVPQFHRVEAASDVLERGTLLIREDQKEYQLQETMAESKNRAEIQL